MGDTPAQPSVKSLDSIALRTARAQMIREQLRARGIRNSQVLCAMASLPRHRFLPPELQTQAYADKALMVRDGQTISQPFIVAFMTAQLAPLQHCRVLEIGTGTGYQTALLAMLTKRVYTIERLENLHNDARLLLAEMGLTNIDFCLADGTHGWREQAPFDRIIVTAGAPAVPAPLLNQLANDGRMIIPLGDRGSQTLMLIHRKDDSFTQKAILDCRFVPLIGTFAWQAVFS